MFDIVILGGGPGGYVAAEKAASLGMSVALIEKDALGGTCLNRGCIPTKSLLNSAKRYKHALDSKAMGVTAEAVSFDLATAMAWKNSTVSRLVANIEFLMKKNKVEIIQGTGSLASANSVKIAETEALVEGKHIIIAAGSVPPPPPPP
ncbi:MAG TPA: FAD-dependent oxidoreductase, partial [Spirochaetales bacterium]|nr:FAD-dependent oxidoreductase [Spirochaetales bacterium]